jgi:hypothetical protein
MGYRRAWPPKRPEKSGNLAKEDTRAHCNKLMASRSLHAFTLGPTSGGMSHGFILEVAKWRMVLIHLIA